MDSLTQMALGAAVGEATLGRRVGRRAMLWGAVCGTLPDLDVLVPLGDAVRDFTYHRSWSHSLIVMAALTPLLVWLILRLHPDTRAHRARWFLLVYLAFATHALLDSFTVYGTQIFWPLPRAPESWSTIFIIDPFYTLPLVIGVLGALGLYRHPRLAFRLNAAGLALSSLYLAWTVAAKLHVEEVTRAALDTQGIAYTRLLTVPAPFNTLLWRALAMGEGGYYEGFHSIVADGPEMSFSRYPSEGELIAPLNGEWAVERLKWFTHGFYSVARRGEAVVMTDLRMGVEPDYVFRFVVGEIGNPHTSPVPPALLPAELRFERLGWMWRRIWHSAP